MEIINLIKLYKGHICWIESYIVDTELAQTDPGYFTEENAVAIVNKKFSEAIEQSGFKPGDEGMTMEDYIDEGYYVSANGHAYQIFWSAINVTEGY